MYVYTSVLYICTLKYMSQGISSCTLLYVCDCGYKNTNVMTHGYARIGLLCAYVYIYMHIYYIVYYHIYILIQNLFER